MRLVRPQGKRLSARWYSTPWVSFGLGLLMFDARADNLLSTRLRYLCGSGFLASFTTYSTLVADIALTTPVYAVFYLIASYAAGFGSVIAGRVVVSSVATTQLRSPGVSDE
jgi:CrcB protein